ncbi:MAG: SidA/IucD/PvdA family monooxygenase [Acidimicrobiaceae bacterium]|nr:SidA/IucD/PvdA family monooxygenase [Acidimicrobiaceae bacterium]MYE74996.1 SidA/IucD/PvdA family monooxygenase [Acidimicrobiaceae bacterium]MYJ41647.1 SidA/IucD/PvdA family monooxygenase [Acidimicrobiaceae bacterium]
MMDHDLIVVGGGAAGLGAVRAALWAAADVALITDEAPGGDCTFTGCVPSKTLLAAARDGLGFAEAMARVRSTVEHIAATESAEVLENEGVTVIEGRARLVTHDTVAVEERRITAPRIVVATGSQPSLPDCIAGLAEAEPLSSETVFDLTGAPESLGIIGGGSTGCELAQAFAAFGTEVTLFEQGPQLLPSEVSEAAALVCEALGQIGVTVRLDTRVEAVEPAPGGVVAVRTSCRDGAADGAPVVCERLLAATGRVPATDDLGLDGMRVKFDPHGHVITNDRMMTSLRGVYAAGDVTGRAFLSHAADEMGRIAAGNALGKGLRGRFREATIPRVVFTDPEVASVGVIPWHAPPGSRVAYLPLTEVDRAVTDGRTDGFIAIVAGPRRLLRNTGGGRILGATIVTPRAGEMIQEIVLAMRTGAFAGRLAQASHAYPTWSNGVQKAAAQFFGEVEGRRARRVG